MLKRLTRRIRAQKKDGLVIHPKKGSDAYAKEKAPNQRTPEVGAKIENV